MIAPVRPRTSPGVVERDGAIQADRAGFWANVATLLVRELRTHGTPPGSAYELAGRV